MMIVADDDGMWMKMLYQKIFNVRLRRLLRKGFGKRNYHQMVNAMLRKQANFLVQRVNQLQRRSGVYNLARVRMKGDEHGFAPNPAGFFPKRLNYFLMTAVHAIKRSNGDDAVFKVESAA